MKSSSSISRGVWLLGFVSLLMDASSEMIHSLLPVFMISVLGASAFAVGLVEGVAEATALIVKVFSGTISDYLSRRKEIVLFGYGLAALSKPLFALAQSVPSVLAARFIDRIGKGIRGAPRDAWIADMTPPSARGAAYGLCQALDTVGAFIGPLLAIIFMMIWRDNFRAAFWIAVIPAFLSVSLLAAGAREPQDPVRARAKNPVEWSKIKQLGGAYWQITAVGAVFALARFSEAFLILRARANGLSNALAPAVYITMNVIFAASAFPVGKLADRLDRRLLLTAGLIVMSVSDLALAHAAGLKMAAVGIAFWGLQLGLTQGLLSAMVADAAPAGLLGTAFGLFNLVSGCAILVSSGLAGILWDKLGAATTFYTGAAFSAAALFLLVLFQY